MSVLVVLTGVRGAGKSTLLKLLEGNSSVQILQPSTDRARRLGETNEYDFRRAWQPEEMAWSIRVGDHNYGMRRSELSRVTSNIVGVTVFDPGNLAVYKEKLRDNAEFEAVLVGLDTIKDLETQATRVGRDPQRVMSEATFQHELSDIRQKSDIVLSGDIEIIRKAFLSVVGLLGSRGGVLERGAIQNLIAAGALLSNADSGQVQPASYDLRLSSKKIWCRGEYMTLDDLNPIAKIPPYSFILVEAMEEARLPRFVVGRFDLKVSLFFSGIILSNGPQVDPGFSGSLFCMLFNGSDVEVGLSRHQHFATIEFCTTTRVAPGYSDHYSWKSGFEQFISSQSSISPGGNLLQRIVEGDNRVRGEVKDKLEGSDRNSAIAIGVIFVILIALLMFAYSTYTELTKAVAEARNSVIETNKMTGELKETLTELNKRKTELKQGLGELEKQINDAKAKRGRTKNTRATITTPAVTQSSGHPSTSSAQQPSSQSHGVKP